MRQQHPTMDRRAFVKWLTCAAGAPLLFGTAPGLAAAPARGAKNTGRKRPMIKPPRLRRGQTVGLLAPASNAWENEDIRFAMEVIESLGFKIKPGKHLFDRINYFAGKDRERADDVNRMFADPDVHAIWALRGGTGSARILPYLDFEMIRNNPKALIGYSDITALHSAVAGHAGLVTFHGPIAKQNFSEYTLAHFKKVLMEPEDRAVLAAPPPFEPAEGQAEKENRLTVFRGGKARGHLIGGNLAIVQQLMGTPYEPQFDGAILFLEDVNEEPYRIDRMLTHLWLSGHLQRVAGIAFGKFTDCDSKNGNSFSIEEIIADRCLPLGVPVIRGLMIGHVEDQATIPIGVQAELDVDAGTITLLEKAVEM
ncbi:LD-carboxypeptidase [Sulfidibacter corallicola]